ncbi:MAG: FtsX-like permease family protein, partial [Candidatus Dadabacteria bacterium]
NLFSEQALELLVAALDVHRRNFFRAGLTSLGIVIGIMSTITMLALGQGAKEQIVRQIETLGANVLVITPSRSFSHGVSNINGDLDYRDYLALKNSLTGVSYITPSMYRNFPVRHLGNTLETRVIGSSPEFYYVNGHKMQIGRFFNEDDIIRAAKVAVLGSKAAERLGVNSSSIGSKIRIGNFDFEIIGILAEKGATSYFDPDLQIVIPISTTMRHFSSDRLLDSVVMQVNDPSTFDMIMFEAEKILRERKGLVPGQKSGLFIRSRTEFLSAMQNTVRSFSYLLAGIAIISLVVGGIGIMNMMLVSVSERRREIGIRKAIGASQRDIRHQFLAEATVLCVAAGIVGVIGGYLLSGLLVRLINWELIISLNSILLALVFSLATGFIFGLYPAIRAARLEPMRALREL